LDLIFSTYGTEVNNLCVNEEFGSSDHSIIQFSVRIETPVFEKKVLLRDMKKANWPRFQELLQVTSDDWNRALDSDDIEAAWRIFIASVNQALDSIAPLKHISMRILRCNPKVRTALRHKRRAYNSLMRVSSISNLIAYERASFISQQAIYRDTNLRERRVTETADQRVFWSYVNQRLSVRPKINVIKHDGNLIHEPPQIASAFNVYFASVYQPTRNPIPSSNDGSDNLEDEVFSQSSIVLTKQNVLDILARLPSKASIDSDGLSYKMIKKGVTHLRHVFFSFSTCHFVPQRSHLLGKLPLSALSTRRIQSLLLKIIVQ
jgi:hypothetical protein